MKNKLITTTMAMLLLVSVFAASYGTLVIAKRPQPGIDFNGPHYNLLIHGVPKDGDKPVPDDQTTGRHSVFMPLDTQGQNVTIYLEMDGIEWLVKDCDATGDGIMNITLPRELWTDSEPDEEPDGVLDTKIANIEGYRVFLVGLGKPSEVSQTIIYSDADVTLADPDAGDRNGTIYWELTEDMLQVGGHRKGKKGQGNTGQPQWYNATDLITATVWIWENDTNLDTNYWNPNDQPWDGTLEGTDGWGDPYWQEVYEYTDYSIFNVPGLEDYWWKVNNNDVRLMQVRFYPILKYVNGNGNGNNH
ncbi:MAG: hypothetical protein O2V44_01925 [Candidatus Bathyarchaeota archaeon]|nr:hypothetical protein [Candidatus Bathyarchaeota archaeon]